MNVLERCWCALLLVAISLLSPDPAFARALGPLTIRGDHTMTEERYGSITIDADNVTLDCKGNQIHASSRSGVNCGFGIPVDQAKCGISVQGRSNVTIKNCLVVGSTFNAGIHVQNSDNVLIQNTTVHAAKTGFHFRFSWGVTLNAVNAHYNEDVGFIKLNSQVNAQWLDAWRNGSTGFRNGFKSRDGAICDHWAEGGGRLSLHAASLEDNGESGFVDCGVSNLSVTDARFVSNGDIGFYADIGDFYTLSSNHFALNASAGLFVDGWLNRSTISDNRAWSNWFVDVFYRGGKPTEGTTWTGNDFGTTGGSVPSSH
jgi:parallel beta-helix repeat protein